MSQPEPGSTADHDTPTMDLDADLHSSTPTFASMCPQEKIIYERCFQDWYVNEFLASTPAGKKLPCPDLYENYRSCVAKQMQELQLHEDVQEITEALHQEAAEAERAEEADKKA